MKSWLLVFFIITLCFAPSLFSEQLRDVVYLENGSIIKGKIIEYEPEEYLKIMTADGSVFVYNVEEISKVETESYETDEPQTEIIFEEKKSPVVAFALSFIVVGLGQFYNGEVLKGVSQEAMVIGGTLTALAFGIDKKETLDGTENNLTPWFFAGYGVATVGILWSWIDAPMSASRINREYNQQGYGHIIEYSNDKYTLGFDIAPNKNGVGAMFTIHF